MQVEDFAYLLEKGNLRRVRTLAGVKFFGAPIGTIITPGMAYMARQTHGDEALRHQLLAEDDAPEPSAEVAIPGQGSGITRQYVEVRDRYGMSGMQERARRQKELQRLRREAMRPGFGSPRPMRFRSLSKKGPVDGDGDGWVYDADKYKKRPATPAEMAAGAALRSRQGGGSGSARGGAAPRTAGGTKGSASPKTTRPPGAGTSIKPDHPKYQARLKEYDDKIDAAKDDGALQRVVAKLQKDLILNDEDYHAVLDRVEAKAKGSSPKTNAPAPKEEVPESREDRGRSLVQRVKDRLAGRKEGVQEAAAAPGEQQQKPSAKQRQVDKMRSQIKNAKQDDDLRRAIANLDHPGLTSPDKLELISEIRAKNDEFKAQSTADRTKTLMGRPVGAMPTFHPGDDEPEVHEEHKAFFADDENSIANAKSEGLWNFILTDSRFEVEANGKAGNATNFWVTDSRNGERWMFKATFFDGYTNPEKTEETMNDFLASDLLQDAGVKAAPTILASVPGEYPAMMAQRDWAQLHAPDGKVFDHARLDSGFFEPHPEQGKGDVSDNAWQISDEAIEKIKNGPNPDVGVEMVLTDYLMNNSLDRHGNNFLMTEHPDGTYEMGIIDHGMAFGTPPLVTGDADSDWELPAKDFFSIYKAFRPEEDGSWNLQRMIAGIADNDRDKLKKQVEGVLKKFFDVDEFEAYDKAVSKNLNADQMKYLDEWLGEFQWRRDWLNDNIDQMVDLIATEGGF